MIALGIYQADKDASAKFRLPINSLKGEFFLCYNCCMTENQDYHLIGIMRDYYGNCDGCGSPNHTENLLVSECQGGYDAYGNRMFLVIGVLTDEEKCLGHRFRCSNCGKLFLLLRLYESVDISSWINPQNNHIEEEK